MAHVIPSFTWETTTTSGTGPVSLEGAAKGYARTFASGVGDQNECEYAIVSSTDFERGKGTVTTGSPDTLSRDIVRASSNNNSKVSFGTEAKNVYVVFTDEYVRNVSIPAVAFTQNSDVDHDSTTSFVANEHIDHSGVSISSGTGLSGGGDITASRTLSLDASTADLNNAASPNTVSAGQLLIWNSTNNQFENTTLTAGSGVGVSNADASITVSADVTSVASKTGDVSLNSSDVGLGNVPNTDATNPANWALNKQDSKFIVGSGGDFVTEGPATARSSLGLGTAATKSVGTGSTNVPQNSDLGTQAYNDQHIAGSSQNTNNGDVTYVV